jgi:NAD(P)-dependent dehydrogenase (short-subunit alcohol dehydrogenase family)
MKGKICVVTGANTGLGFESTLAFAQKGAYVIMICRSIERGEKARQEIMDRSGNPNIHLILADLSSQEAIRKAAHLITFRWGKVDVLMNNAAMVLSRRILNDAGIEMQFAVNHLSYFLLTYYLMPCLTASAHARIVNISSRNHWFGKIHFDNLTLHNKYQLLRAYAQSKLANVMFTYELDRRLRTLGIDHVKTHCVDPGRNFTDIGIKHTNPFHGMIWKLRRKISQQPADGAKTQVYVASSPNVYHLSGKYWRDSRECPSSPRSRNTEEAHKLWQVSKGFCGIQDYFEPLTIQLNKAKVQTGALAAVE